MLGLERRPASAVLLALFACTNASAPATSPTAGHCDVGTCKVRR